MTPFATEMTEVIVRGLVLMSSAWLVVFALRRRSASLRAGVWTVAFAALLALPAIARVTPAWKIAVLPAIEMTPAARTGFEVPGSGARRDQLQDERALRTIAGSGALQDQRALPTNAGP